MRDCSVLLTVTLLGRAAQLVSRAPPQHKLLAFLNLNGIKSDSVKYSPKYPEDENPESCRILDRTQNKKSRFLGFGVPIKSDNKATTKI